MNKIIAISGFILCGLAMQGQNPFAKFKVEHYDTKKGLPGDFIMNVYQSKDGFIWTNGYSGYTRFDGKRFLNYSSKNIPVIKADNNVSLFTESQDSTMWFTTTSSGLLAFQKGVFKAYLTEFPNLFYVGKTRKGELIISIGGMHADKYIVFNTTTLKYFPFGADELSHYMYTRLNNSDTVSGKWNIKGGKLYHLNDAGNAELIGAKQGVTGDMSLSIFMVDSKKRTWMTSEWGLYVWNGEKMIAYPGMEKTAIIPTNPTFGLMIEDKDHGIWVSTGHGILGYLPDGDSTFHLFPKEYLNIQALNNLAVDREGNIWVATDRGLFKLSKTKLINYASAEGIENNRVTAICQTDSNTFLVGNFYNQWYELKNGQVKPFVSRDDVLLKESGICYYSFVDSKKNKWLCCNRLIYKISDKEQKAFRLDGEARYGFEGIDGRIYFGVPYKGIGYINDKGVVEYLPLKGIDFSQIYLSSIRQLKDGTWVVCSFRTGVYFIKPDGQVKNVDISDDFKGVQVFASYVDPKDDNALWFASGAGLVKFEGDKKKIIGSNAGIPDLALFDILPDHTGRWWLPTNTGIISVRKSQLDSFINNPSFRVDWEIIDEGDGMSNRQCVGARHSIVSADGRLMVLSIGGLVELDPGSIHKNETAPLVSVNQMLVDDSSYHATSASIVGPGNHRYIFDYSALSFMAPEKNKIKFRLVGYDDKWINSVGDQRAFYTNLPPGDYHFEVMASNNDGLWSKEAASFSFYVQPFFYQTLWFKILLAFIFLLVIWFIIRWRTAAARKKSSWLEKEVSLRTGELKKSNEAILIQKQEIEQALEKLKATQSQLIQAEKMASLGELTAGIAHEIQNPLNFVNNFSEVSNELMGEMKGELATGNLQLATEIADDISRNLEKINHHGKRADAIVKGMLQHSRSGTGQKEPTDINALCDEYLRLSYHGIRARESSFNAAIKTDFDVSIAKINVIPQDLGRVLLNLYNNAFYAVNEKQMQKATDYEPAVSVTTKKTGNSITINIKDNGNGIPQHLIDKIFQPFFTTKPTGQGTGLGLSLVYDIVKAQGGQITVDTREGEGSAFTISLPVDSFN